MTAMLCLTTNDEPTYYYSSYNGKNMGGIRIPKALINTKRVKASNPSKQTKSSGTKPYVSLVELGIPNDLNFFKQSALHSSDGLFHSIAWTTLDEVRREFFNGKQIWTYDRALQEAKKYKSVGECQSKDSTLYHWAHKNDLVRDIFSHCNFRTEWTTEMILEEAKKYSKKVDFMKSQAFKAAKRRKIVDDVCSHMEKNIRWNKEMVMDIIKNNNITHYFDLRKFNNAAFKAAGRFGIKLKSGRR
jgi:metal-sulfur cluster biosynthetic enzyme